MNVKLKILNQMKAKIEKRIQYLSSIMSARPLSDICDIRIEFTKIVKKYGIRSDEASRFATENSDKEQELFKLARKQQKLHIKGCDLLADLNAELYEINTQIAIINIRNKRYAEKRIIQQAQEQS